MEVRGIGPRSIERIEPYVTVGDASGTSAAAPVLAAPVVSTRPRVNINTATLENLDTLPGIGPALAGRIIEFRTEYGAFRSVEELMLVRGIGAKTMESLLDFVTVDD